MTTILVVRKADQVAICGDGQITAGDLVMKKTANKIRQLYDGKVIAGFAGSVADALTLFERFEGHLEKTSGQLKKAAVELAKEWRTDKALRRLEAQLIVADINETLIISGEGDVIEPDEPVCGIGAGAGYAQAAATALIKFCNFSALDIAKISMDITADISIYTNKNISVLELKK